MAKEGLTPRNSKPLVVLIAPYIYVNIEKAYKVPFAPYHYTLLPFSAEPGPRLEMLWLLEVFVTVLIFLTTERLVGIVIFMEEN